MDNLIKTRKYEAENISGKTILRIYDTIEMNDYNMENRVKVIAYLKNMDLMDIANQFGISQKNNFLRRLRAEKLSFAEQQKIADILGVIIKHEIILKNGRTIEVDSSRGLITELCRWMNLSISDIAEKFGVTRQALNERMNRDKFSRDDLNTIAGLADATYNNYFEFDGIRL